MFVGGVVVVAAVFVVVDVCCCRCRMLLAVFVVVQGCECRMVDRRRDRKRFDHLPLIMRRDKPLAVAIADAASFAPSYGPWLGD